MFNRTDLDRLASLCIPDRKTYLDLVAESLDARHENSTQETAHICLRYLAKCIGELGKRRHDLLNLVAQAKPTTHAEQLALGVIEGELAQLKATHEAYRNLSSDLIAEYGHYQPIQPYLMSKSEAKRLLEQCRSTNPLD